METYFKNRRRVKNTPERRFFTHGFVRKRHKSGDARSSDEKRCRMEESVEMKKTEWKKWFRAAGIRAVKTVAQTAVATIGTAAVLGEVNWVMVGSAAALSGILSLLTSVAGLPECPKADSAAQKE